MQVEVIAALALRVLVRWRFCGDRFRYSVDDEAFWLQMGRGGSYRVRVSVARHSCWRQTGLGLRGEPEATSLPPSTWPPPLAGARDDDEESLRIDEPLDGSGSFWNVPLLFFRGFLE